MSENLWRASTFETCDMADSYVERNFWRKFIGTQHDEPDGRAVATCGPPRARREAGVRLLATNAAT